MKMEGRTMDRTDEEMTEEVIGEPWRHTMMHEFNVDEHDDLWRELEAQQKQIDELFALVTHLAERHV